MSTADDFSKALDKVNLELKAGNTGVKVERRGDRLFRDFPANKPPVQPVSTALNRPVRDLPVNRIPLLSLPPP
jgi:hypothetical protein